MTTMIGLAAIGILAAAYRLGIRQIERKLDAQDQRAWHAGNMKEYRR